MQIAIHQFFMLVCVSISGNASSRLRIALRDASSQFSSAVRIMHQVPSATEPPTCRPPLQFAGNNLRVDGKMIRVIGC